MPPCFSHQKPRKIAPRIGIEPGRGFVEQQHFGFMHDGLPDGEPLAHAARQFRCRARHAVGKTDAVAAWRPPPPPDRVETMRPGRERQALPNTERVIKSEEIRQIAQLFMDGARAVARVAPGNGIVPP